jgi:hypothetical protein
MMRFELNLPAAEKMEELATLMRMIIFLIDHMPSIKLPPAVRLLDSLSRRVVHRDGLTLAVGSLRSYDQAKARADKKRAKAAEEEAKAAHAQRQEAAQQKKAEKRASDKEKLKELPPDQQARAADKEARRARKKKMGKLKVNSSPPHLFVFITRQSLRVVSRSLTPLDHRRLCTAKPQRREQPREAEKRRACMLVPDEERQTRSCVRACEDVCYLFLDANYVTWDVVASHKLDGGGGGVGC